MAVIEVALADRSYEVQVGAGLLNEAIVNARDCLEPYRSGGRKAPVIADRNAHRFHGERLSRSLATEGYAIDWYLLDPGEGSKSWAELERLVDWLLERGIARGDTIFALGGGVTGDLVGFAAAILKRGCAFVQLPTTLLAQVDSSVGGKTAINTRVGKNLVGAFHQPALVLADLATLDTLPPREMRAGWAEVLKYGLLGDAAFFAWCEASGGAVLAGDRAAQEHAVVTSVRMKAQIVAQDERETRGRRALLNLGHTFGHALEAETGFSDKLLHGEAVALGMVLAARYSARLGHLAMAQAERITAALDAAGLPSEIAALGLTCDGNRLAAHMLHDKKMAGGTLPFILLRAIGDAYLHHAADLGDVAAFIDEQLRSH